MAYDEIAESRPWRALYKCRRCGNLDDSTCGSKELLGRAVTEATVTGCCTRHGIPVPMVSSHRCPDKGIGVTDLVGCEPEGT